MMNGKGDRKNMIEYIAYTKKGDRREKNEDRIFIDNKILAEGTISGKAEDGLVAVVCDGVGGNAGGEIAAEIAAGSFKDFDIPQTSVVSLNKHIQRTNREIMEEQKKHPDYKNMASTIAGIVLWKNQYIFFNLGDTRIYDISNNHIQVKSQDHILNDYGKRNYITHYLGGDGHYCQPYMLKGSFKENVKSYLICSDGFYKSLYDDKKIKSQQFSKFLLQDKRIILNNMVQNNPFDDFSFIYIQKR